jgi:3-keto-5-aminohexanoate cleavage enzyme
MSDYGWDYLNPYTWMARVNSANPLIVTCAVNGGVQGKEAHPAIPETADDIAEAAREAYEAGAAAVHIHGRDPGRLWDCTGDAEVYLEINAKVRAQCPDIIVNNTTGGGLSTTHEDRLNQLSAVPEMASLNLGPDMARYVIRPRPAPLPHPHSGFTADQCIPATYGRIEELASSMLAHGIKAEMELYDPGHFWVSRNLIEKGLVEPPYVFQLVMGTQTEIFPTPENLICMVRQLPADAMFSVIGVGKFQWAMTTLGIILGGNVRVGLEDNLYNKRGQKLVGNGEAVEKIIRIAKELGREVASPAQARAMLGLSSAPRQYATQPPRSESHRDLPSGTQPVTAGPRRGQRP